MSIRVWILIIALVLASLAIAPWKVFESGALITSVNQNSTSFEAGLRQGMVIQSINYEKISNPEEYGEIINSLSLEKTSPTKVIFGTDSGEFILLLKENPDITVSDIPNTKIQTGLDLSGGARALVKPANISASQSEISDLIAITTERFNTFGLKDITIRSVKDLSGNNYMLVEIAGATPQDLKDLVGQQGKFEAKIGNETVFVGGDKDIASVCRNDATCSGIYECGKSSEGNYCNFRFSLFLSEDAAKRHAEITKDLPVNSTPSGNYLSKKLDLYLDDVLVDSLWIGESLKGQVTTQISISGSGVGATESDAYDDAKHSMQKLQTVLITGSLPYKLEIVKLDTISPNLGKKFTQNLVFLALLVFLIISIVIFLKYRKIKMTLAVILTMFSEALITLGIAALINWNLDAPGIAGIIAGMGTGVNDQILIIDESVSNTHMSIKERIKRAFFIILGAFFTIIAAMLPLFWAGAGMLRGFALTTIIGVCVGIFITRPAFMDIIKRIQD